MRRTCLPGCLVLASCLAAGCSQGPAPDPGGGEAPGRDYGDLLRDARERRAGTMNEDRLQEAVAAFERELGRAPTNLAEVVRYGFIDAVPEPPEGMVYRYDPTNRLLQTVAEEP